MVYVCTVESCGAPVADGGQDAHDLDLHILKVYDDGPNGGKYLWLGDKRVGFLYRNDQHYNLARAVTVTTWKANLDGHPIVGDERQGKAMEMACKVVGAKGWARGKNPKKIQRLG